MIDADIGEARATASPARAAAAELSPPRPEVRHALRWMLLAAGEGGDRPAPATAPVGPRWRIG